MSELSSESDRVWEVDCLRGLAVCLMLVSNFLFDLCYFYSIGNLESGFLSLFSRSVAGLFLFIVGVSLTLSVNKKVKTSFKQVYLRSIKLFAVASGISLATYFAVGENFILFGILHLISFSIVLGYFFLEQTWLNLILGIIVITLGLFIDIIEWGSWWLLWLGFPPLGFYSVDYTPLIPWFGPVLIGVFVGNTFYRRRKSLFDRVGISRYSLFDGLGYLGKKSLIIYCVHQPLLWVGFMLFGAIK